MNVTCITPDDPRWRNCLDKIPHDVYQIPEYVSFCGDFEHGEAIAFCEGRDGEILLPLLRRRLPDILNLPAGWQDAASPYGYPSLLLQPGTSLDNFRRLMEKLIHAAREQGLVSMFVRLHPLLDLPHALLSQFGQLVRHGQTVYIDLNRSLDELRCETRENHRRGINKLQRKGFRSTIDNWQHLSEFASIYRATMSRAGADSFYMFSDDYFAQFRDRLQDHVHLCSIISPDNDLSAAAIFTTCGDIIQYHLGGTSPDYLKEAPSKLIFDAIRTWGKAAGYRYFHLGGGLGAIQDSLFHFKAGFSAERRDFYTFRLIIDELKYQTCLDSWQKLQPADSSAAGDFFPGYRRA